MIIIAISVNVDIRNYVDVGIITIVATTAAFTSATTIANTIPAVTTPHDHHKQGRQTVISI